MICGAKIATVLIGVSLAFGTSAYGKSYDIVACGDAPGGANHSWTASNAAPSKLEADTGCATPSSLGLFVRDKVAVSNASAGTNADWSFAAPGGTVITQIDYDRWLHKMDDDDWMPALEADTVPIESCSIIYPAVSCDVGIPSGARALLPILSATRLSLRVRCSATGATTCVNGGTMHNAYAVLYGATVTLSDPSAPAVSDVGGSLFGGGFIAGSRVARFDASDNSGIRGGRLYVDGVVRGSASYGCDFTYVVPCSDRDDSEIAVDTRLLSDGSHDIQVGATDAAGNEAKSSSQTVTVDNTAPTPPTGILVASGDSWRSENSFDVTWSNPSGQVAPIAAARYQLCALDGSGCTLEQRVSSDGIAQLDDIAAPSQGEWQLRVWLEDSAGNVDPTTASTATLRYGTAPVVPPTSPDPDPGPVTPLPGPVDPGPATDGGVPGTPVEQADSSLLSPVLAPSLARPALRIFSARYSRGRLVLRGRTAPGAAGTLSLRVRSRSRSRLVRTHVRGGAFRVTVPADRPRRRLSVRFGATTFFAAQTVPVRVR